MPKVVSSTMACLWGLALEKTMPVLLHFASSGATVEHPPDKGHPGIQISLYTWWWWENTPLGRLWGRMLKIIPFLLATTFWMGCPSTLSPQQLGMPTHLTWYAHAHLSLYLAHIAPLCHTTWLLPTTPQPHPPQLPQKDMALLIHKRTASVANVISILIGIVFAITIYCNGMAAPKTVIASAIIVTFSK